jgi:hypothetical protein
MRRRRLDVYRDSPPWPGKDRTLAFERARYDQMLIAAAEMLDVPIPDEEPGPAQPLPPEVRAALEDRLGEAGLDVFAPRRTTPGDEDVIF